MRTTVTLDDDIASELDRIAFETKKPFKFVINDLLKRGLRDLRTPAPLEAKPFFLPHHSGDPRPDIDFNKTSDLLAMLDDEDFLRVTAQSK